MNRRQLFLSSAKAALLGLFGGSSLARGAKAQPAKIAATGPGGWVSKVYNLIGKVTGAPGSPTATLNIPGDQLPPPPQPFGGSIELNAAQSKPFWPMRVVPPQGAPNIVLILTDDVGFAAPSTFGGVIPTPTLDRIAANGLRYTNFHTTSLCSPTRAALITGQEPPFGRLRRRLRAVDRFSRLQQRHHQGHRHHRAHPARQRLSHLVVRQEPQHADLSGEPGWAVRSMAGRHGVRALLRFRRRGFEPVAAESVQRHHADLPLCRQA